MNSIFLLLKVVRAKERIDEELRLQQEENQKKKESKGSQKQSNNSGNT